MGNLFKVGRICYGLAMAGIGVVSMYYRALPYILSPPANLRPSLLVAIADIFGALLILTGTGIALNKQVRQLSLLLGWALLAIGVLYSIPETLLANPHPLHFDEWENVEKVLALAAGAFVIAGHISATRALRPGAIVFAITMICFGILHFMEAVAAEAYIPSWIPYHLFWMYFCGAALIASGIGIIFRIMPWLSAVLLGSMILTWFIILHIPRVMVAQVGMDGELNSAFFALAYGGTAWAISASKIDGRTPKIDRRRPLTQGLKKSIAGRK
jgi:hypothetical protein